jgi:transcriptional regulator with XRE-family HTH domain
MPSLRKQFGIRLKEIRIDRKMTQERFAECLGISVDFLSLIERGINAPSFETIEQDGPKLAAPGQGAVRVPGEEGEQIDAGVVSNRRGVPKRFGAPIQRTAKIGGFP